VQRKFSDVVDNLGLCARNVLCGILHKRTHTSERGVGMGWTNRSPGSLIRHVAFRAALHSRRDPSFAA